MSDECDSSKVCGFKVESEVRNMCSLNLNKLWFHVYLGGGFGSYCSHLMRCQIVSWANHSRHASSLSCACFVSFSWVGIVVRCLLVINNSFSLYFSPNVKNHWIMNTYYYLWTMQCCNSYWEGVFDDWKSTSSYILNLHLGLPKFRTQILFLV